MYNATDYRFISPSLIEEYPVSVDAFVCLSMRLKSGHLVKKNPDIYIYIEITICLQNARQSSILTVFLRFILIEETLEVVISLKFIVYDIKMEGNGSRCILLVVYGLQSACTYHQYSCVLFP